MVPLLQGLQSALPQSSANTDTEVQHRAKKAKTLQSGDYEKTKEHEKAREQYSKAQEKLSKTQEKLKEILQSGDTEKANALMEDCVKTKKKLEEMIKTMPPEEVPIPLLLIVIIMNFIITSSSSDLAAHLHQDLAEGEPQQD